MTQSAKVQEPSMEEILASIRRIIADDDANKVPKPAEPPAAKAPAPAPAPPPAAPTPPPAPAAEPLANSQDDVDASSDIVFTKRSPDAPPPEPALRIIEERNAPPPAPAAATPPAAPAIDQGLISSATRAAVDSAFNSLANTVLGQNARTLEDLVKEMLRPMLRAWLDDNLPGLVERIVRAEIERVSRGRG
jgi:uncharacterized protein